MTRNYKSSIGIRQAAAADLRGHSVCSMIRVLDGSGSPGILASAMTDLASFSDCRNLKRMSASPN